MAPSGELRGKGGMVYLQCKKLCDPCWVLQKWSISLEALYKCQNTYTFTFYMQRVSLFCHWHKIRLVIQCVMSSVVSCVIYYYTLITVSKKCRWYSVDGILSALETRCLVTGSPAPVVSAVMLGGKLRTLLSADSVTQTHSILTTESRVRIILCTFDILVFLWVH